MRIAQQETAIHAHRAHVGSGKAQQQCARILAEARRRRHQPSFHAILLRWAANQRRQAAACVEVQRDLFA